MSLPRIENADVTGKTVFIRTDLGQACNTRGEVIDVNRLQTSLPTLELLLNRGAGLIIASHIGRPENETSRKAGFQNLADILGARLGRPVRFHQGWEGRVREKIGNVEPGEIVLLDNLLQLPGEGKNEAALAERLSHLADIYVNDDFDGSQYKLASQVALPRKMESYAGLYLNREIEALESLLNGAPKPLLFILGGIGLARKIKLIRKLLADHPDHLLIGGGIAYTFLKSRAIPVGNSLIDSDLQVEAFQVIEKAELEGVDLQLPQDHVIAEQFSRDSKTKVVGKMNIPPAWVALDIGPRSIGAYEKLIKKAGTVFWYGPMGAVEMDRFSGASVALAKSLARSRARTFVTGQDGIRILNEAGVTGKIDHICHGTGTAVKLILGEAVPGIEALHSIS